MSEVFHAKFPVTMLTLPVWTVFRRVLKIALIMAGFGLGMPAAAQTDDTLPAPQEYLLGAADEISVRIVAWDSGRLAFVQYSELGGDYTVGPTGTVMMPLLGVVQAAGRTPQDLAEEIATSARRKMGLSQSPSTAVEVKTYRPVYVLGDVARPGAYEYRPGLSALQAVALAGGLYRLGAENGGELVAAIRTTGTLREVSMDRVRQQLRAARLRAEADGLTQFQPPLDLEAPGGIEALNAMLEQENILFSSRRDTLQNARAELAAGRDLLEKEIAARSGKLAGLTKQVTLVRESVGNAETLVDRGLSRSQNLILLQRTLIDLEAKALDTETGIFKAQQQISELNRDEADLISARRLETLRELQATEAEIDRLSNRAAVSRRILRETEAGAVLSGRDIGDPISVVRYQILRDGPNGQEALPAERETQLRPLDVLEIILDDLPDGENNGL